MRASIPWSSGIDTIRTREAGLRVSVADIPRVEQERADTRRYRDTQHQFTRNGLALTAHVVDVGADQGYALVFGDDLPSDNCLVRIHSRCLYGDALGSDDCDCGPELGLAMDLIQQEGSGILVYLEQEGRGAGLINKARAYGYSQQHDADTFESYDRLGLQPDYRRYTAAAATIDALGVQKIRLLTNNPAKVRDLRAAGLEVVMTPLLIPPPNSTVHRYLEAKRAHRQHKLPRSWKFYRWIDRLTRVALLMVFGSCCAALAYVLRSVVLMLWERVLPGSTVPAGGFVIVAVGVASVLGLAAGKRDSLRQRLLKARLASWIALLQSR